MTGSSNSFVKQVEAECYPSVFCVTLLLVACRCSSASNTGRNTAITLHSEQILPDALHLLSSRHAVVCTSVLVVSCSAECGEAVFDAF
jgi:hypothetical protein